MNKTSKAETGEGNAPRVYRDHFTIDEVLEKFQKVASERDVLRGGLEEAFRVIVSLNQECEAWKESHNQAMRERDTAIAKAGGSNS